MNIKTKYLQQTLSKNEEILDTCTTHWSSFILPYLFFGICAMLALIPIVMFIISDAEFSFSVFAVIFIYSLPMWLPLFWILHLSKREFVVTNKRVITKNGVLFINTDELKNEKIESISVTQGPIARLFNAGNFYFSGVGTTKVSFPGICSPFIHKTRCEEIIEKNGGL